MEGKTPRSHMDQRAPAGWQAEPEPEPRVPGARLAPLDAFSSSLLTDMYQITMAYSYWFNNRHTDHASYDLFFRKNPFDGEYTIFCGLEECLRLVDSFQFTDEQVAYLRKIMPGTEEAFFEWLSTVDCSEVRVYAQQEGSVTFPRVPLLRVEGPLAVCQMLETPLLNLCNYASLVATNATRLKTAAGPGKGLIEIGLRHAQGPDGGVSASRYSFIGGFDGTSNVTAGLIFSILPKGAHHHAYIMSYSSIEELGAKEDGGRDICTSTGEVVDLVDHAQAWAEKLSSRCGLAAGNQGELAAFCAYARSYPTNFLAHVDTYDALKSGLSNFLAVSLALHSAGYAPVGIALDSGDLAYQSKEARRVFRKVADTFEIPSFRELRIVGSNGIDVSTLDSLRAQSHEIDVFCVGTDVVTCEAQPALGMVYKLCEIEGTPCIKISGDVEKMTIPGRKSAYRLYNKSQEALMDLLVEMPPRGADGGDSSSVDKVPKVGERVLAKHPFDEVKRAYVTPSKVVPLHRLVYGPLDGDEGSGKSQLLMEFPSIDVVRERVMVELEAMRSDHRRILNPTPYKVSVTNQLHLHLHALWQQHVPITDLS